MALAAIQALNQKLNEKDAEIQALKQSVAELKETLRHLTKTELKGTGMKNHASRPADSARSRPSFPDAGSNLQH